MIGLGCYGVIGALKTYREKKAKRDPDWEESSDTLPLISTKVGSSSSANDLAADALISMTDRITRSSSKTELDDKHIASIETGGKHGPQLGKYTPQKGDVVVKGSPRAPKHHHDHSDITLSEACPLLPHVDMHDPTTQRIISFSIGLLHGVAGPGGILGVLPAVEMQNWESSFVYLGSFILTSTLSMGVFAALYGELTRRLGATAESVELALSVFSAAMSILVGTIWLVLSVLGKLDALFH
jgi:hypothetical protein